MIKIEHLAKSFGDLHVLRDVNATIEDGEVISIIGPSGTGKSTFLRCLNLLERPTSGSITIDGVNILDKKTDVPLLRRKMGMVFQSFNLFEHLSIMENLTIGPMKLLGRSREEAEKRGMELLKTVGLAEKHDYYPSQLSGGQKQRVAIARCLSMDPKIILFDEPTSALDPTMVSEVLGVIRQLAKSGMTMAIVTHEMNFARDVSTRVFYMDEGIVYEAGTPQQIFDNPQTEKARMFINRVRNLHFTIKSPDYDLYELNSQIEAFSAKHFFTKKRRHNLLLLTEELLQILPVVGGVDISMEFSEKTGVVSFRVIQHNYSKPIIENPDVDILSLSIIKGICREEVETVKDGEVDIILTVAE